MKYTRTTLLAAALLAVAAALPAGDEPREEHRHSAPVRYVRDRFHDFLDIFRVRAGAPTDGKALGLKARATALAQIGYVTFNGRYFGLDRRGAGLVDEKRRESGISLLYGSYNTMVANRGNAFLRGDTPWTWWADRRILRNLPHWDDGRQRPLSVGFELALPILAVDLGVYPEEAVDFVFGWVTLDLFRDDSLRGAAKPKDTPTAAPVPDGEKPFAARRKKFDAIRKQFADKELEKSGQAPTTAPAEGKGSLLDRDEATTSTLPRTPATADTIEPGAAERASEALEKLEKARPLPPLEEELPPVAPLPPPPDEE